MKFDLFSTFQEFLAGQRENLLLWVPVFLGIGSASYFGLSYEPSFLATGSGLAGSFALLMGLFRLYGRRHDSVLVLMSLIAAGCLCCLMTGFAAGQFKTNLVKTPMLERETRPVMVEGTLDHREDQEGKKGTLLFLSDLRIEDWPTEKTPSSIRITLKKKSDAVSGDRIKFLAKLTPLSPPVAPDTYDFARHYYFESIGALGFALSDVEVVQSTPANIFNLEKLRTRISTDIKAVVPERQAGIVSALMTGERAAIFDEDWDALRASGLAHIISISGMHVVMVAAPVFFVVRLFLAMFPFIALRFPIKKIAAGVALAVCCLYVGLVVPSVPTTRALLMTGMGLIAIMLDRSPFSLRLVAFSAIIVLLTSPESIWSVSFQMSFAAVTALVAVAEAMRPTLIRVYADAGWIKRSALFVGGTILTSFVAGLATAPYSLYHFEQIASYSVLANTLSVPISGLLIMPMLVISYVLMPFGLADWSLKLMGLGVEWLLEVARWTQNLSGSVLTTSAVPEIFMVMITLMGLILILFQGWGRVAAVIPLAIALMSLAWIQPPDILISDEGGVVAVKDDDAVYVSSARRDKFAVETWLKRWNSPTKDTLKFPRQGRVELSNGGYISCDPAACRIETRGIHLAFGTRPYELQQDCNWANIMVSDARLPRKFCGDKQVQVYGHYHFKQSGALSITAGEKTPLIKTVGESQGRRPWVIQQK